MTVKIDYLLKYKLTVCFTMTTWWAFESSCIYVLQDLLFWIFGSTTGSTFDTAFKQKPRRASLKVCLEVLNRACVYPGKFSSTKQYVCGGCTWMNKGRTQVRPPENLSCHIRAPLLLHEVSEKWVGWGMVCLLQQKCGFMSNYQRG